MIFSIHHARGWTWYKLFIYLLPGLCFIYSTTTILLAFGRVGFERDSQKTNYILLNLSPMLTHSVFSKNAIRKVIPFLKFKIVEIWVLSKVYNHWFSFYRAKFHNDSEQNIAISYGSSPPSVVQLTFALKEIFNWNVARRPLRILVKRFLENPRCNLHSLSSTKENTEGNVITSVYLRRGWDLKGPRK